VGVEVTVLHCLFFFVINIHSCFSYKFCVKLFAFRALRLLFGIMMGMHLVKICSKPYKDQAACLGYMWKLAVRTVECDFGVCKLTFLKPQRWNLA